MSITNVFLDVMRIMVMPVMLKMTTGRCFRHAAQQVMPLLPVVSALSVTFVVNVVMTRGTTDVLTYDLVITMTIVLRGMLKLTLNCNLSSLIKDRPSGQSTVTVRINVRGSNLTASLTTARFTLFPVTTMPKTVFSM